MTEATAIPGKSRAESLVIAARAEYAVFLASTGVIGLHVADDNFLQPEPGHLGGRSPGQRPRPARRARAGSVAVSAPAGRRARGDRARPRHVRDRRGDRGRLLPGEGKRLRRRLHRVAGNPGRVRCCWVSGRRRSGARDAAAAARAATCGGRSSRCARSPRCCSSSGPFSLSYVFTHVARGFVPTPELGAPYEEVSFTTSDGLELEGWYIPSKNRAAVIAFPGRRGPQRPARMLARHGYGVLLFDRRGRRRERGRSEHLRLARRAGSPRGRRLPAEPLRRRRRSDRRYRPLGRRRDDARGRGGVRRPRGGRLGRGGNPVAPRGRGDSGDAPSHRGHPRASGRDTERRALLQLAASAGARRPREPDLPLARSSSSTRSPARAARPSSARRSTTPRGSPRRSGGFPAPSTRAASRRSRPSTRSGSSASSTARS